MTKTTTRVFGQMANVFNRASGGMAFPTPGQDNRCQYTLAFAKFDSVDIMTAWQTTSHQMTRHPSACWCWCSWARQYCEMMFMVWTNLMNSAYTYRSIYSILQGRMEYILRTGYIREIRILDYTDLWVAKYMYCRSVNILYINIYSDIMIFLVQFYILCA